MIPPNSEPTCQLTIAAEQFGEEPLDGDEDLDYASCDEFEDSGSTYAQAETHRGTSASFSCYIKDPIIGAELSAADTASGAVTRSVSLCRQKSMDRLYNGMYDTDVVVDSSMEELEGHSRHALHFPSAHDFGP